MVTQRRTVIHRSPWSHKGGQSYTAHHGHTKADSHTPLTMVTQRRTVIHRSPWSHKGGQSYTAHRGHTKADSHTPLTMVTQRRTVIHRSPWSHKGGQSYTAHHGHTKAEKRYSPWSHKGGQSDSQGRRETTTSEGTEREAGTPAGTRDRRLVQHVFQRTRKDTGSCNTCLSGQGRTPARTAQ